MECHSCSRRPFVLAAAALLTLGVAGAALAEPFQIRVVDSETGRGVPMVKLESVNGLVFYTDSNGVAAVQEPGYMEQRVYFHVKSHGYHYAEDGFGNAGQAFDVAPGGEATLEIERENIAERLYRLTGEGIYRDSVLVGEETPLDNPVINAGVTGQDTVQTALYRDQLYWIWGDTDLTRYPLGVFQSTGAVSDLPGDGGLDPSDGVNLRYFTGEDGYARAMAPIVDDGGILVWIDAMTTVPDENGEERLVGRYETLHSLSEPIGHGVLLFNDDEEVFEEYAALDPDDAWRHPKGHPATVEDGGTEYLLFPRPFPVARAPARLEALADAGAYQAFTCLAPGGEMDGAESPVMRDGDGQLVWAWRADADPVGQEEEEVLLEAGLIDESEARFQLRDADTGDSIELHRATFYPNAYRDCWIMIGVERYGRSFLGEIWYAEAPSPTGPWTDARRIVTHEDYCFYNPAQHPYFDEDGGRIIYFEGTYTNMFTGDDYPESPRYEYNQIMYRLDLSDERLR